MRKKLILSGIFLLLSFSVFAKPKTELIDDKVPESWNFVGDTIFKHQQPIEQEWWKVFNNPTISSLIDKVIANNYDLVEALNRIASAKAAMRVSQGGFYPSLNVQTTYDFNNATYSNGVNQSVGSFGAEMQWEIDIIGAVRNRAKAQKLQYRASIDEYNAVMTSLIAQTVTTFAQLRQTQLRLDVVKRNLESQKGTLAITEARFKSGLCSALDVAQAQSIYYSTAAQVPIFEDQVGTYINALGVLCGSVPWQLNNELGLSSLKIGKDEIILVPVGIPAELLRQRPDVRAAEKYIDANASLIGASIADWLPKFFINGQVGVASPNYNNLFAEENLYWQVAPTISWNIFSGTTLSGQIQENRANLERAIAKYNNTVLTALQETDNAMGSYKTSILASQESEKAFDAAKLTLTLALDLYKKGLIDFQTVLDAQRSLLQYEDAYVQAKSSIYINLCALYKALGGGWVIE